MDRLWRFVGLIIAWQTLSVMGDLSAARIKEPPELPDLPELYLPGNPLPIDAVCYTPGDELDLRCAVSRLNHDVYFRLDEDTRLIVRTLIPGQNYTIGQLVIDWGTPTGETRGNGLIYVHWGRRSALVFSRTLKPASRVEFVQYDLAEQEGTPWRGFRRQAAEPHVS